MNIYVFVVVVESASLFLSDRRRGEKKETRREDYLRPFYYLCLLQYIIISYNMIFISPKT